MLHLQLMGSFQGRKHITPDLDALAAGTRRDESATRKSKSTMFMQEQREKQRTYKTVRIRIHRQISR